MGKRGKRTPTTSSHTVFFHTQASVLSFGGIPHVTRPTNLQGKHLESLDSLSSLICQLFCFFLTEVPSSPCERCNVANQQHCHFYESMNSSVSAAAGVSPINGQQP
jgi:hypothetical protein